MLTESGKINLAEKQMRTLLKRHPRNYFVNFGMGIINIKKSKIIEALYYFNKAVEIFPLFVEGWYNKGMVHLQNFEIDEMIHAFRKVVELGDADVDFVKNAKTILSDFESDLLQKDGLNLDVFLKIKTIFDRAFAGMEQQDWNKAILGFKKVLAVNPDHIQSWGNLGICYGMLGQKSEALAAFNQALALDRNYEPAKDNRQLVLTLEEGESLSKFGFTSTDYYMEKHRQRKRL